MILFQWLCHSIKNFIAKFCRRMDPEFRFWGENLKSSLFTPRFPSKAPFTKFQFECCVHDLVIKKNNQSFEFRKMGGCTVIVNKRVSEKLPVILKIGLFVISL